MNRSIYLDTNIFITAFPTTESLSESAWSMLDAVTRGELHARTSELTLAELLPKPIGSGSRLLVEIYVGLTETGGTFSVAVVSRTVLVRSAAFGARHPGTRLPDAIHMTTALAFGCSAFVSNDRRIALPGTMPLIRLGPDSLATIERLVA